MGRKYLTVKEYSKKHGIPQSTLYGWMKDGSLEHISGYPMRIPDDIEPPKKDPAKHKWRYQR